MTIIHFLGVLMDACIRSIRGTEVLGISCISYIQSSLFDTSRINDASIDAYLFVMTTQGKYFDRRAFLRIFVAPYLKLKFFK